MSRVFKIAVAAIVAAPAIVGCSYFKSEATREAEAPMTRPVEKLTSECARLQPLFGPDVQELTRDGMEEGLKRELAKWDKDNNGELNYAEVQPLNDELREMNVGAAPVRDWNGDGVTNYQEFASGWRTMFELCDRNRSKTVSWRELGYSPNVTAPRQAPSAPKKPKTQEGASERPNAGGY